MKKTIILLAIITVLLLISGCNKNPTPVDVYTGSKGVVIKLLDNIPPEKIYEQQKFLVAVDLSNQGAYSFDEEKKEHGVINIHYDKLFLSSVADQDELGNLFFREDSLGFVLKGKSQGWPTGERMMKELALLQANKIKGTREMVDVDIIASACYPYKTTISETICIDFDINEADQSPSCRAKEKYTYGNQGAPIAIKSIEPAMIPVGRNSLQATFYVTIANVGDGLVFSNEINKYSSIEAACNPSSGQKDFDDINSVSVKGWIGGVNDESELKCNPNPVKIIGNEGTILCYMDGNTQGVYRNFATPVTFELSYIYRTQDSKTITIQRSYIDSQ